MINMENNNRPVGVFDSGLGGLTTVRELRAILPNEDIIYLGDTARVPYGTRSRETILRYAHQDLSFLERFGVKFTIVACGTVSSVIVGESSFSKSHCTGVIEPAVNAAVRSTKNGRIGVIATGASVRSQSYEKLIRSAMPEAEVYSKACPMFVPLVENGYTSPESVPTLAIAREYLEPLAESGIDVLILGCTHYPLLADVIKKVIGDGVKLISSGAEAAKAAKLRMETMGLLSSAASPGSIRMFCTDSPELFRENARHFIDTSGISVDRCSVEM